MTKIYPSILSFLLITSTACTSTQPKQKSNLTFGNIKKSITIGYTNQYDIIRLLGTPNITTKNGDNDEVWTYSRQSYDASAEVAPATLLTSLVAIFTGNSLGGDKAVVSQASATFDLIIVFDKNNIVRDYSVVQSQF